MSITRVTMQSGIERLAKAMERDFEMLNAIDGALGDGDLGVTMTRGMRMVLQTADQLPDDLGMALLACAQAFTKSSGSSYGTLMATGLMAMAKLVKGQTSVSISEVSCLVAVARDAMMARGKAELGGKTVLDSLDAIARATKDLDDRDELANAATHAVQQALDDMRDKPATIGRARIFAQKSIGMDDPGMVAMKQIIIALADRDDLEKKTGKG